jgi:hypothetical protein
MYDIIPYGFLGPDPSKVPTLALGDVNVTGSRRQGPRAGREPAGDAVIECVGVLCTAAPQARYLDLVVVRDPALVRSSAVRVGDWNLLHRHELRYCGFAC